MLKNRFNQTDYIQQAGQSVLNSPNISPPLGVLIQELETRPVPPHTQQSRSGPGPGLALRLFRLGLVISPPCRFLSMLRLRLD